MSLLRSVITSVAITCSAVAAHAAANYDINFQIVNNPEYPTDDVIVAGINILDHYPDANKGERDVTYIIQEMLDDLGEKSTQPIANYRCGGGVLYLPAGVYKISEITIPKGVTLRGDWAKPEKGKPIKGTIIAVTDKRKGSEDQKYAAVTMNMISMIQGVTFWYPDQSPDNPSPYPPTVNYLNDSDSYYMCHLRQVCFLNSWFGINACPYDTWKAGQIPTLREIYGSPLSTGIAWDNMADEGRIEFVDFSPRYWAGSGLKGAGDASAWIYGNAVGIDMRRNDWTVSSNINIEGYHTGYCLRYSPYADVIRAYGEPNGAIYKAEFKNCYEGVQISCSSSSGTAFTSISTPGCNIGIHKVPSDKQNPVSFNGCDIYGSMYAVYSEQGSEKTEGNSSSLLQFETCRLDGEVLIAGGEIIADNCEFLRKTSLTHISRGIFSSNKYLAGPINYTSKYKGIVDHEKRAVAQVPDYDPQLWTPRVTKPARIALYLGSDYGVKTFRINTNPKTATDTSAEIQAALDAAGRDGGGIVYLAGGHYVCRNPLTIPTGVELRGYNDNPGYPFGQGTTLEVMTGEDDPSAPPFITMSPRSGIRGINFNYPNQDASVYSKDDNGTVVFTPHEYPYAIRGNADCYMVNIGIRATDKGIDLFTNKCDNHYVDYFTGMAFRDVIRVGGRSDNGLISNLHFNTYVYKWGHGIPYGSWPNSTQNKAEAFANSVSHFTFQNCDFMTIGDCTRQSLFANFMYGCRYGYHFIDEGNGGADCIFVQNAIDGSAFAIMAEATRSDLNLINPQLVSFVNGNWVTTNNLFESCYFNTTSTFNRTINAFGPKCWARNVKATDIKGGTLNTYCMTLRDNLSPVVCASGSGRVNIVNSELHNIMSASGKTGMSCIYSAIHSPNRKGSFNKYVDVLSFTWSIGETDGVETVIADDDDAPVEYYDLQGRRVDNPGRGIYIRRQGSAVTKIVL